MSAGASTLEAVNTMLGAINESPVNSLDTGGSSDAANAERILNRVSREIQGEGWHCNREFKITLSPNNDDEIDLPTTYLRIDSDGSYAHKNVARRGDKLYNLTDHTFAFTDSITITAIKFLDFVDLTPALKKLIVMQAAREFQQEVRGGQVSDRFATEKVIMARTEALHEDAENEDASLLDAPDMRQIIGRRTRTNIDY